MVNTRHMYVIGNTCITRGREIQKVKSINENSIFLANCLLLITMKQYFLYVTEGHYNHKVSALIHSTKNHIIMLVQIITTMKIGWCFKVHFSPVILSQFVPIIKVHLFTTKS